MKFALLLALSLVVSAVATSCCSGDNDIVVKTLDRSAGICDDSVFPAGCCQAKAPLPTGK